MGSAAIFLSFLLFFLLFYLKNFAAMKFCIHLLILFAIVTAGISPACAFMGAQKGWIEICASDGSVKRIQVSSDYLPDEKDSAPAEQSSLMEDCLFCFATAQGKAASSPSFLVMTSLTSGYIAVGSGTYIPRNLQSAPFAPRGPPAFS